MNELALFSGAGGGLLGGKLLGWRTVCAVEREPYPAAVLCARQNDGILPPCPVWDDVRTFDGHPWRGRVDVVSGGFPCQDISAAGTGAGIEGARSGLWKEMFRIICEVRPRFVYVENSPMLTSRGIDRVLRDLASVGFDAEWDVFGAHHVGAPHRRERIWILAYADNGGTEWGQQFTQGGEGARNVANACGIGRDTMEQEDVRGKESTRSSGAPLQCAVESREQGWWKSEPGVGRMAHGVAARVDKLKALGNGQVPAVAAMAFRILYKQLLGREYDPLCAPKEGM